MHKLNLVKITAPQNIIQALHSLALMKHYNHDTYRFLLTQLLRMGKDQVTKHHAHNASLRVILADYIAFGCEDNQAAK